MQHAGGHPVATWVNDLFASGYSAEQVREALWRRASERLKEAVDLYVEGELAVRRSGR